MMKIAVPTENGVLFPHFGHCSTFTVFEIDTADNNIRSAETLTPPPHDHGVLPAWLHQLGCTHIIAGGMGQRAVMLFEQNGVRVLSGVPTMRAEDAVRALLRGELATGANQCDHSGQHGHGHGQGGGNCGGGCHND